MLLHMSNGMQLQMIFYFMQYDHFRAFIQIYVLNDRQYGYY